MHKYEITVVFKPAFDDEALAAELEKVQDLIRRFGGTVEKVDSWGKRRLAYEIQKVGEGFYYFLTVDAEPGFPRALEDRLRITESVLRYLIIRLDK